MIAENIEEMEIYHVGKGTFPLTLWYWHEIRYIPGLDNTA